MRRGPAAVLAVGLLLLLSSAGAQAQALEFAVDVFAGVGRLAKLQFQISNRGAVAEDPDFSISIAPVEVETIECNYQTDDHFVRKRPGRTKYSNIVLKRGYVPSSDSSRFFADWFHESAACLVSPDCSSWGGKSSVRDFEITVWPASSIRDGADSVLYSFKSCLATAWQVASVCASGACRQVEEVVLRIGHIDIVTATPSPPDPAAGAVAVPEGSSSVQFLFMDPAGAAGQKRTAPLSVARYLNPGAAVVPARMAPRCEPGGGKDNDCDGFVVQDDGGCVEDPDALFACHSTKALARLADACGINVTLSAAPAAADAASSDLAHAFNPKPHSLDVQYNPKELGLDKKVAGWGTTTYRGSTSCQRVINSGTQCSTGCFGGECLSLSDELFDRFGTPLRLVPEGGDGVTTVDCAYVADSLRSHGGPMSGSYRATTSPPRPGRPPLDPPDENEGASLADSQPEIFFPAAEQAKIIARIRKRPDLLTQAWDDVIQARLRKRPEMLYQAWDDTIQTTIHARLRKRPDLLLQEWDMLIDEQMVQYRLQNPIPVESRGGPDLLLQEWDTLVDEQLELLKDNPLARRGGAVPKGGYVAQGALLLEPAPGAPQATVGALSALRRQAALHHRRLARAHARRRAGSDEYADDMVVVTFAERDPSPLTCLSTAGVAAELPAAEAFAQGRSVGVRAARPGCTAGPDGDCDDYFENAFLRQYDFPLFNASGVFGGRLWVSVDRPVSTCCEGVTSAVAASSATKATP